MASLVTDRPVRDYPDAIAATREIASRCAFDLGELSYQYPHERVLEGRTAQEALETLTRQAVTARFPDGVPEPPPPRSRTNSSSSASSTTRPTSWRRRTARHRHPNNLQSGSAPGLAGPALVKATPCKDPKTGKFIKCPPLAAAATTSKKPVCRDSKGHFAKCGTPGASQPK